MLSQLGLAAVAVAAGRTAAAARHQFPIFNQIYTNHGARLNNNIYTIQSLHLQISLQRFKALAANEQLFVTDASKQQWLITRNNNYLFMCNADRFLLLLLLLRCCLEGGHGGGRCSAKRRRVYSPGWPRG